MHKNKVLCVVGTRPECIKVAPVITALRNRPDMDCRLLATAQHRSMLDQVLQVFSISPDFDLDLMRSGQDLASLTARLLLGIDQILKAERPQVVLAQGDTTTTMAAAMSCFYNHIPFGHVEAGLRTWDISSPFPEEMNRVVAGYLAKWHFAPTESARQNLLKEGVKEQDITVTGNTVIDALYSALAQDYRSPVDVEPGKRLILVTAHRRESFGQPLRNICGGILDLCERNQDVRFLYPVHPNPNVKEPVSKMLGNHAQIILCDPLEYRPFLSALKQSYLILSDSGGVQEEAPALGKPVLVLRDKTERPEAVQAGVAKLVGTDRQRITEEVQRLLDDEKAYGEMAKGASPYGDGKAAQRIVAVLDEYFKSQPV